MSTDAWELSKENVVPLKRGRSAKGLSEAIQNIDAAKGKKSLELKTEAEKLQAFETELASKETDEEIIEIYVRHFKWIRDTFPSDTSRSLAFLERCTCDLKSSESLKNDLRFVTMWIEYADSVRTPGEIFSFMQSNKIGDKCALFWVAWAYVAEKAQNFNLTDQIFQKGIKRQALPKELLQKRHQQFQRRMARHYLTLSEKAETEGESKTAEESRKALGLLCKSQASGGASRIGPSTQQNQQGLGNKPHGEKSNRGFDIFSDQTPNDPLVENTGWKSLAKKKDAQKENDGKVAKWTDGALPVPDNHSLSSLHSRPLLSFAPPTIPIFVDDQFAVEKEEKAVVDDEQKTKPGLSVRAKVEGYLVEKISKDPLARHRLKDDETGATESIDVIKSEQTVSSTSQIFADSNPTTKGKPNSVASPGPKERTAFFPFTIYSDEAPNSKSDVKKEKKSAGLGKSSDKTSSVSLGPKVLPASTECKVPDKAPFTIYSDEAPNSKSDVMKNETRSTGAGFTIPTDSLSVNARHFDENIVLKQSAPKSGFTIFVDNSCQNKFIRDVVDENERKALSTNKKMSNFDFKGESPSMKTCQQEEDDEVMAVLGILDSDDTTINTKLAKVDIDAMFCSPGLSTTQRKTTKLQLQQTIGELSDIKEASGDCDRSIFGSIATPFMHSTTKTFDGELWASRIQKDEGPEIRSKLQFIPKDDAIKNIKFPDKSFSAVHKTQQKFHDIRESTENVFYLSSSSDEASSDQSTDKKKQHPQYLLDDVSDGCIDLESIMKQPEESILSSLVEKENLSYTDLEEALHQTNIVNHPILTQIEAFSSSDSVKKVAKSKRFKNKKADDTINDNKIIQNNLDEMMSPSKKRRRTFRDDDLGPYWQILSSKPPRASMSTLVDKVEITDFQTDSFHKNIDRNYTSSPQLSLSTSKSLIVLNDGDDFINTERKKTFTVENIKSDSHRRRRNTKSCSLQQLSVVTSSSHKLKRSLTETDVQGANVVTHELEDSDEISRECFSKDFGHRINAEKEIGREVAANDTNSNEISQEQVVKPQELFSIPVTCKIFDGHRKEGILAVAQVSKVTAVARYVAEEFKIDLDLHSAVIDEINSLVQFKDLQGQIFNFNLQNKEDVEILKEVCAFSKDVCEFTLRIRSISRDFQNSGVQNNIRDEQLKAMLTDITETSEIEDNSKDDIKLPHDQSNVTSLIGCESIQIDRVAKWKMDLLPNLEFLCQLSTLNTNQPFTLISDIDADLPQALLKRQKKMNKKERECTIPIFDGDLQNGVMSFTTMKNLGEGGFGYVLKASKISVIVTNLRKINIDSAAIKVGRNIGYLIWESIIHLRIQFRLQKDDILYQIYSHSFIPPLSLLIFRNASVMIMKYGDLGNLITAGNMLHNQAISPFTKQDFEYCVLSIALQALRSMTALHSCDILHADVKTDNWVLRTNETGSDIQLCLIDFGKAIDLKELKEILGSSSVAITGSSAIKHFECHEMLSNEPWTFQADYYGLCASIHNLLFFEELKVVSLTAIEAARSGFLMALEDEKYSNVQVPSKSLKRYWDHEIWTAFYYILLNGNEITTPKDLKPLILLFENKILKTDERVREESITKLIRLLKTFE